MSYQCSSEQNYWLMNMKFRYVSICTGSGWIQCILYCSVHHAILNRLTTSDVLKGRNGWVMYHDSYPLIVATPYSLHGVIGWWFVSWRCIRINVSHMYAPLVISYILYPCNYLIKRSSRKEFQKFNKQFKKLVNVIDHVYSINVVITVTSYWARWRLKSPASWFFSQSSVQAQIKEIIKDPRHRPLWGKPPVTGGNYFHLMTSSYD